MRGVTFVCVCERGLLQKYSGRKQDANKTKYYQGKQSNHEYGHSHTSFG